LIEHEDGETDDRLDAGPDISLADSCHSAQAAHPGAGAAISNLRKRRDTTDIDNVPSSVFATEAPHEDRLALKELAQAMTRLPSDQREALVMVVVHGMSYEALAASTGCAVGTAKSRVFRARRQLEAWLLGETRETNKASRNAAALLARRLAEGEREVPQT